MKRSCLLLFLLHCVMMLSAQISTVISLKKPGNHSVSYKLEKRNAQLVANEELPVDLQYRMQEYDDSFEYTIILKAKENVWFHLSNNYLLSDLNYANSQFYLPGFWYKKNERSPENAPSLRVSSDWMFREDRLSTPLSSVYDTELNKYYTVMRMGTHNTDALSTHSSGEVMLSDETEVGYVGFAKSENNVELRFGIPAWEYPYAYVRKLTLAPEIKNFMFLEKGDKREYTWKITKGNADSYAHFVKNVWQYSIDELNPNFIVNKLTNEEVKHILSQFYLNAFVDAGDLKGLSGSEIRVDQCELHKRFEVGFVGRVLLNAFNSLEYGESVHNQRLISVGTQIYDSYLENGFVKEGFFRELWSPDGETDIYSIRRQSEGAYAALLYLDYEHKKDRKHPQWEDKIKHLLDAMIQLQNDDYSFPRKFKADAQIVDASGGSSACIIPTLVMASSYFNNKKYMDVARKTADYIEKELVSKADYFSSTLDANCEDKEASYYTATAYYYLAMNSKGKERAHYVDMAKEAAYFAATWYYLWDVPFAKGQMLGDMGFQTRGWGNVSVENNHVDAYVFDLATVFEWLSTETEELRFSQLALLMRTSMHEQLLPYPNHMCGVAKIGYHPEVVQHTQWDYGRNGKGYYNDIFAPGWVVASLWQMLMPDRVTSFLDKKTRK